MNLSGSKSSQWAEICRAELVPEPRLAKLLEVTMAEIIAMRTDARHVAEACGREKLSTVNDFVRHFSADSAACAELADALGVDQSRIPSTGQQDGESQEQALANAVAKRAQALLALGRLDHNLRLEAGALLTESVIRAGSGLPCVRAEGEDGCATWDTPRTPMTAGTLTCAPTVSRVAMEERLRLMAPELAALYVGTGKGGKATAESADIDDGGFLSGRGFVP